jgi:hypothetical protein
MPAVLRTGLAKFPPVADVIPAHRWFALSGGALGGVAPFHTDTPGVWRKKEDSYETNGRHKKKVSHGTGILKVSAFHHIPPGWIGFWNFRECEN